MKEYLARIGVNGPALTLLTVMALTFLLQLIEVARTQVLLFGMCTFVLYVAEWLVARRVQVLSKVLSRIRVGLTVRMLARQVLTLTLFASVGVVGGTIWWIVVAGVAAFFSLTLGYDLLRHQVLRRAKLPAQTRNIDLSSLSLPRVPKLLRKLPMNRVLPADLPLVLGTVIHLGGGSAWWTVAGSLLSVGAALALFVAVLPIFLDHLWHSPTDETVLTSINEQLAALRPEVVLYFAFGVGEHNAVYQANMWLQALEHLDRRALVIFREHGNMPHLDPTFLPVVCVPRADDLAALDLSTVRVALYPGNTGKNIHLIQRAEIKHVFVGHGDSDKLPSSNRVSRIFDEIWVAGRGGRDRYRRVQHAIDDEGIVEVGRPQLVEVEGPRSPDARAVPTVIYAPTWEGVDDNNYLTSADTVGLELVERLLRNPEPVRLVYKPHPLLGKRSPRAAAAHRRIIALVEEANAALEPVPDEAEQELASLRKQIDHFRADAAEQHLSEADILAHRSLIRRWHDLYWTSAGPLRHHVVTDSLPSLFSAFNQADAMISDISSVVADFIAGGKPYAVTNLWDLDDEEFRRQYPSAGAGYVLRPGVAGLDTILSAARAPSEDPLAERRDILKHYLLGPDEPDAQTRFAAAVDDLYQRGLRDFPLGTVAAPIPADPFTGSQNRIKADVVNSWTWASP